MTSTEPYLPTWYAAGRVLPAIRPSLTYDLDVDVCVVGGGLAGLTTAREVARRGWSVALIEAGRVAARATGRNRGVVAPGFSESMEAIIRRLGLRHARELWALSMGGVGYVRELIRETGMPGVELVDGQLVVRTIDDEDALLRQVALLRVDLGADVEPWPTVQVREALSSLLYYQAMHVAAAFHMNPLNYALGLAAAAEQAGTRIFEESPAIAIDAGGVRKRIDTPNGRVRAGHVVLAGGVDLGEVFPALAETIVPVVSHVAVTAPLGDKVKEAIRFAGAITEGRRASNCYRLLEGGRLLWGSRMAMVAAGPRRIARMIQRDIEAVFPQLAGVEIADAWSGTAAYAVHNMPQIGELSRGVWTAGAFGLNGIAASTMAGQLIARAITDDDDRWRLFSDYELVWAGARAGRAVAQAVFWSMPACDAAAARMAQLTRALRERAAERAKRKVAARARRTAETAARRLARPARGALPVPAPAPPRREVEVVAASPAEPAAAEAAQREAEVVTGRLAAALREAAVHADNRPGGDASPFEAAESAIAGLMEAAAPVRRRTADEADELRNGPRGGP